MKLSNLKNIILLSFAFFSFSSFTLMDFWNERIPQNLPTISVDQFGNAVTTFPIELPVALKEIAPN
ncbi:hypothetical protein NUH30_12580 [Leptospira sp. 85282-16]|nr:hypothetical protein [Leptospira sp. 85282-16]MCT8334511.1 hypothetical protein [Leptospira sp. 85282-16]